jgi:DNA recombination protein RmuC
MGDHWARVGKSLGSAVESYNKATSSLESRVLPTARKLKELHAGTDAEIEILLPLESLPRPLQAPELAAPDGAGK